MKNLNILEERIKKKQKTLLIFDYVGTLTPINYNYPELATISPIIKRSLENLSKLNFLDINIITENKKNKFDSENIKIHEIKVSENKKADKTKSKKNIVNDLINENKEHFPFYFGDDIDDCPAFKEVKKLKGFAIGIRPLDESIQSIVDSQISYLRFEEFLADLNNLYT